MKTQNEKKNKPSQLFLKLIIGAIIGISFGFGIGKMVKSNYGLTTAIEKALQENCDCELVYKDISTVGIQFSKEDGFTNQKASYVLKNCNYKGSAMEEALRIDEHLKASVENYDSVDVIELIFHSDGEKELVKIKDGSIL